MLYNLGYISVLHTLAFLTPSKYFTYNSHITSFSNVKTPGSKNPFQRQISFSISTQEHGVDGVMSSDDFQPECGVLSPGQVISIRFGDISQPKKAWKKRRRSGSPLLVPCTIVGMNRESMVKSNLIHLLHRFGSKPDDDDTMNNGVVLNLSAAVKLYKSRLGGNLLEHAKALGHPTIASYIEATFDQNTLDEQGVNAYRSNDTKSQLILASALSTRIAREAVSKASLVQFIPNVAEDKGMMIHTGTSFQAANGNEIFSLIKDNPLQLSAAVRVSQSDADANRIYPGLECNAFVLSYDNVGDNGNPLLICTIDPPRSQIRDQMKRKSYIQRQMALTKDKIESKKMFSGIQSNTIRDLSDIKVGEGPIKATVIRVSTRSGAAFVDIGVGRKTGKKSGGGLARVLGMLRFEDVVQNSLDSKSSTIDDIYGSSKLTEEEEAIIEASLLVEGDDSREVDNDDDVDEAFTVEDLFMDDEYESTEDVTDLYSLDNEGNMYMIDPSTGDKVFLGSTEPDDADFDSDETNLFSGLDASQRLEALGKLLETEENSQKRNKKNETEFQPDFDAKFLKMGDEIDVYIRAVYPQSGRFMVTLDAGMRNRKLKDIKREEEAVKRLNRLSNKFGNTDGLQLILNNIGKELNGTVKAQSKSGDWYYVQPDINEVEGVTIPVGIAKNGLGSALVSGQKVVVRLDGVDDSRGQVAMTITATR
jgi:hypothetical protein